MKRRPASDSEPPTTEVATRTTKTFRSPRITVWPRKSETAGRSPGRASTRKPSRGASHASRVEPGTRRAGTNGVRIVAATTAATPRSTTSTPSTPGGPSTPSRAAQSPGPTTVPSASSVAKPAFAAIRSVGEVTRVGTIACNVGRTAADSAEPAATTTSRAGSPASVTAHHTRRPARTDEPA